MNPRAEESMDPRDLSCSLKRQKLETFEGEQEERRLRKTEGSK